ncbi:MAG: chromosomal replication initiator protein DnaA [Acidobacteria bacterium]|nr:MAG: chromosomal replication initiator protein DnaA [Acidobacteriota bacterium]
MLVEKSFPSQPLFSCLQRRVGSQTFDTWFRPLRITSSRNERVVRIAAPSAVVKDWILTHYSDALRDSLAESKLDQYKVEWILASRQGAAVRQSPLNSSSSPHERSTESRLPNSDEDIAPFVESNNSSLNEKYTFSSFVVAGCNRFAHAAAKAVAESPGRTYNPLYLYGGVGLGKTHLIQAAGHAIKAANPHLQIAYLSLERFMNELINAIRYGYDKTRVFRERYRSIDVLLIDDIQFIAGKERTQEEFFHTFNALYDAQKQIVLTSDCPPREIPEIEERLHSRFEWGLIADIEPPDIETKVAILRRKAELQSIKLPDDVALYLAGNSKHNIRELEGSLIRVMAMASLRGVPLSKSLAQEAMRNVTRPVEENAVTIPMIQKVVADYYKVTADDLRARSNARQVLVPRQVAMYLCKRFTKKSFPEIARQFGGKHHTTVIHSVEKIDRLFGSDREMEATIRRLSSSLETQ